VIKCEWISADFGISVAPSQGTPQIETRNPGLLTTNEYLHGQVPYTLIKAGLRLCATEVELSDSNTLTRQYAD
jgi:hypothetical protein